MQRRRPRSDERAQGDLIVEAWSPRRPRAGSEGRQVLQDVTRWLRGHRCTFGALFLLVYLFRLCRVSDERARKARGTGDTNLLQRLQTSGDHHQVQPAVGNLSCDENPWAPRLSLAPSLQPSRYTTPLRPESVHQPRPPAGNSAFLSIPTLVKNIST